MKIGLRIDVDTFRGTKLGVPNLCELLAKYSLKATFFFSVGPDNMGRHLWRLVRLKVLWKMLRIKASSLYGLDIIFKGTFWPGPVIGDKLAEVIRAADRDGHEIGLHGWDHHGWQRHIDSMSRDEIHRSMREGVESLTKILGRAPLCSAVPAWKCNDLVLEEKEKFGFVYNSDCRGESIFIPIVNGCKLCQPQIPATLPTYDEVIGRYDISDVNYNDYIFSLLRDEKLNVLTVHAEVEGISRLNMFERFIGMVLSRDIAIVPLGKLLGEREHMAYSYITPGMTPGREGWVAFQKEEMKR